MENRSHALMAGLFALILIIGGIAAAIWISKKNIPLMPYEIVSTAPVTGLSAKSEVRYQGVPVGRVDAMRFIPEKPGQVRINIAVDPRAPITLGTWAELVTSGVTGVSHIELRDNGDLPTLLTSSAKDVQTIPMRPSFWERLQSQGGGMIASAERVLSQLEKFTNSETAVAFQKTMQNTAAATGKLNDTLRALDPSLKRLPNLIDSITTTADRIGALTTSAQQSMNLVNAPNGPLHEAARSLQSLRQGLAQVQSSTLPDLAVLSVSVSDAARSFAATTRQLGQSPQSLLFGSPPAMPGPGEPGFAGFGSVSH